MLYMFKAFVSYTFRTRLLRLVTFTICTFSVSAKGRKRFTCPAEMGSVLPSLRLTDPIPETQCLYV
jgi:hypothetical protein